MKYILYKTTNLLDGKYYIGCHETHSLNDGYLGSGKHLKRAIKKYGKQNFKFEILLFATTREEMFKYEKEIVNENLIKDPLSYNLKIGGSGGNPGLVGAFKGHKHTEETKNKIRNSALKQIVTDDTKKKLSENSWAKRDPVAQRKHASKISKNRPKSEEQRKKLSEIQKGKKLVNNGKVAIFVDHINVSELLSQGWKLGKL